MLWEKLKPRQADADEGLMLNEQGYVAECTGDNIFIVKTGKVITPPRIGWFSQRNHARHSNRNPRRVQTALERGQPDPLRYLHGRRMLFLTGTAAETIAAIELDQRVIGNGKPGPVTQRCVTRYPRDRQLAGNPRSEAESPEFPVIPKLPVLTETAHLSTVKIHTLDPPVPE